MKKVCIFPRCPHCDAPIDQVFWVRTATLRFTEAGWQWMDYDSRNSRYQCWECYQTLFEEELEDLGITKQLRGQ